MAFTAGLAVKVGVGVVLLGGGVAGSYFIYDSVSNSISKYDRALIDFLRDDDANDIIFSVKKGDDGTTDLSADDISFSNSNNTIKAMVKVTANTSTTNETFKKGSSTREASNLDEIKKLGKNTDGWTWECSFNFVVEGNDANGKTIEDKYKDRMWKSPDLGLFGLLKKDISNYTDSQPVAVDKWTKRKIKSVKIDFIKMCAMERGNAKNKKLNGQKADDSEIKVENVEIKFKKSGDKLVPEDSWTFDQWFISEERSKWSYNTTSSGSAS